MFRRSLIAWGLRKKAGSPFYTEKHLSSLEPTGKIGVFASRPQGRILGAYVIAYAVIRFVLEFLRYDYERGILWVFSTSQWISLILLPIGIWLLARRAKAGEKPVSVEPAGAGEAVEKE